MTKAHGGHSEEFLLQMMERVGIGRTPDELLREFEKRVRSMRERNLAAESEDFGRLGCPTAGRALREARREIRRLRRECDSLQNELLALIREARRVRAA